MAEVTTAERVGAADADEGLEEAEEDVGEATLVCLVEDDDAVATEGGILKELPRRRVPSVKYLTRVAGEEQSSNRTV